MGAVPSGGRLMRSVVGVGWLAVPLLACCAAVAPAPSPMLKVSGAAQFWGCGRSSVVGGDAAGGAVKAGSLVSSWCLVLCI